MSARALVRVCATAGLLVLLSSCWLPLHRAKKATPAAPPPAPVLTAPPKPVEQPQIPAPTVAIESQPPQTPQVLEQPPQLPGPPKPARRRRVNAKPAQPAPAEVVGPPAPTPAQQQQSQQPAVQLAPLLSEADQRTYSAAVADLLGKAERNLAAAQSRRPNAQQRQLMQQARRFIAQCQEVRGRDLPAAKSLAERAEIISREVLAQFK